MKYKKKEREKIQSIICSTSYILKINNPLTIIGRYIHNFDSISTRKYDFIFVRKYFAFNKTSSEFLVNSIDTKGNGHQ